MLLRLLCPVRLRAAEQQKASTRKQLPGVPRSLRQVETTNQKAKKLHKIFSLSSGADDIRDVWLSFPVVLPHAFFHQLRNNI